MGESRSPVEAAYDEWSETYDADRNATRDLDALVLRRHEQALHLPGSDVVEFGCGTGKNTAWLIERARSVVALDFSEGMLAKARVRVPDEHVRFVRHDVTEPWPLPAGCADVVVGNLVLEHIARVRPVFDNAVRVLRPGGRLFVCELHPYRQLDGAQAQYVDQSSGATVRVPAIRHSVAEFVNEALDTGLRLVRLDEWREDGAEPMKAPRLLSIIFER